MSSLARIGCHPRCGNEFGLFGHPPGELMDASIVGSLLVDTECMSDRKTRTAAVVTVIGTAASSRRLQRCRQRLAWGCGGAEHHGSVSPLFIFTRLEFPIGGGSNRPQSVHQQQRRTESLVGDCCRRGTIARSLERFLVCSSFGSEYLASPVAGTANMVSSRPQDSNQQLDMQRGMAMASS